MASRLWGIVLARAISKIASRRCLLMARRGLPVDGGWYRYVFPFLPFLDFQIVALERFKSGDADNT
jgi:hypothetical protein